MSLSVLGKSIISLSALKITNTRRIIMQFAYVRRAPDCRCHFYLYPSCWLLRWQHFFPFNRLQELFTIAHKSSMAVLVLGLPPMASGCSNTNCFHFP